MTLSDGHTIAVLAVLGRLLETGGISGEAYDLISDALLGTSKPKDLPLYALEQWETEHRNGS